MARKPKPITEICITRPTVASGRDVVPGQVLTIGEQVAAGDAALLMALKKARPATAEDKKAAKAKDK